MLFIPQKNALFVHIPKTGGDYVTKRLLQLIPSAIVPESGGIGGKHCPHWMLKEKPVYTFAFVREPVSWYRSYYRFIVDHYIHPNGHYPIFEKGRWHPQRRFEQYDFSTFESFVESVYADESAYYTRMVEWFTGPENAHMLNFIGKQENLNHDLAAVLNHLGYHAQAQSIMIDNRRENTSNSSTVKVTDAMRSLIHQQEHAFYRRFGYADV